MRDGAILCNTGHFNVEIDLPALRSLAVETRAAREYVEEFTLTDGRRLYLLAEGVSSTSPRPKGIPRS